MRPEIRGTGLPPGSISNPGAKLYRSEANGEHVVYRLRCGGASYGVIKGCQAPRCPCHKALMIKHKPIIKLNVPHFPQQEDIPAAAGYPGVDRMDIRIFSLSHNTRTREKIYFA